MCQKFEKRLAYVNLDILAIAKKYCNIASLNYAVRWKLTKLLSKI